MALEIGESLNQILNGLEDLGLDEIPPDMEQDLRMAMNLPLDSISIPSSSVASASPLFGMSPKQESAVAESVAAQLLQLEMLAFRQEQQQQQLASSATA